MPTAPESHPEPDQLGRYRCTVCRDFTADPTRVHAWCRRHADKPAHWRND